VHGIFHKRGFCDVAASAGWLHTGLGGVYLEFVVAVHLSR
jgi:hypothetical protein